MAATTSFFRANFKLAINKKTLTLYFAALYLTQLGQIYSSEVYRVRARTREESRCYLEIPFGVQSSRLGRVMEVILEIDINESYVWQLVYQDLLLPCRFHRPRGRRRGGSAVSTS